MLKKQNLEKKISCDCIAINSEKVTKLKKIILPDQKITGLADFFKLFADKTRTKVLSALEKEELCVCDLSALLEMSPSLISHQLKKLKEATLVKARKEGKMVFYSLDDEHVQDLLKTAQTHLAEKIKKGGF